MALQKTSQLPIFYVQCKYPKIHLRKMRKKVAETFCWK